MHFSGQWLRRLVALAAAVWLISGPVPALSAPALPAASPPRQSVYSGGLELRVHLHEVDDDRREPLTKAVKEAADNVQAYLRSGLDGAVDIDLVGSEDAFSEVMAKHSVSGWDERWLAGLAMLQERRIIVHVNGTRALTTRETLEHELVHVGLHSASGGRYLPAWYQEGVATLLAGEATFERMRDLAGAAPLGQLESLANLNEGFHGSQVARQRAYATAAGFLQFATRRAGGIGAIGDLQKRLQEGAALERAFAMTFGAPPADLYAVYAAQIQASASAWAVLLSDNAIWSVISLLGMFAMLQAYRNRPRPERAAGDSGEEDEPIDLEAIAAAGQQALRRPWHAAQLARDRSSLNPMDALGERADAAVLAALDPWQEAQPLGEGATEAPGGEPGEAPGRAQVDGDDSGNEVNGNERNDDNGNDDNGNGNAHRALGPKLASGPTQRQPIEDQFSGFAVHAALPTGHGDRPPRPWHIRDFTKEPLRVALHPSATEAADAELLEPAEPPEITSDTTEPWPRTLH